MLYTVLCKWAIAFCLKNDVHILIKSTLLIKHANYHLKLQQVVIFLLV